MASADMFPSTVEQNENMFLKSDINAGVMPLDILEISRRTVLRHWPQDRFGRRVDHARFPSLVEVLDILQAKCCSVLFSVSSYER